MSALFFVSLFQRSLLHLTKRSCFSSSEKQPYVGLGVGEQDLLYTFSIFIKIYTRFLKKVSLENETCVRYNKNVRRGTYVRDTIKKAVQYGHLLDMVYLSEKGQITKRRVKVFKIEDEYMYAFCFLRQAKRSFKISNILALEPVYTKGIVVI